MIASLALVPASDCVFCQIIAGDSPAQIVDQDEHTLAFMDVSPATRGHVLVVPRRHSPDLLQIGPEDLDATMRMAQRLAGRLEERLRADGVNLLNACGAAAWQTVIPRYEDDPLKLPWTPQRGDQDEIAAVAQELR